MMVGVPSSYSGDLTWWAARYSFDSEKNPMPSDGKYLYIDLRDAST